MPRSDAAVGRREGLGIHFLLRRSGNLYNGAYKALIARHVDAIATGGYDPSMKLAQAVDDSPAREVIRRQLDANTVAEHDANPVPLQAPRHIAEGLMPVVERHAVHLPAQRLRDLALDLDRRFLRAHSCPIQ